MACIRLLFSLFPTPCTGMDLGPAVSAMVVGLVLKVLSELANHITPQPYKSVASSSYLINDPMVDGEKTLPPVTIRTMPRMEWKVMVTRMAVVL
jgi:hypothetical protein